MTHAEYLQAKKNEKAFIQIDPKAAMYAINNTPYRGVYNIFCFVWLAAAIVSTVAVFYFFSWLVGLVFVLFLWFATVNILLRIASFFVIRYAENAEYFFIGLSATGIIRVEVLDE